MGFTGKTVVREIPRYGFWRTEKLRGVDGPRTRSNDCWKFFARYPERKFTVNTLYWTIHRERSQSRPLVESGELQDLMKVVAGVDPLLGQQFFQEQLVSRKSLAEAELQPINAR